MSNESQQRQAQKLHTRKGSVEYDSFRSILP